MENKPVKAVSNKKRKRSQSHESKGAPQKQIAVTEDPSKKLKHSQEKPSFKTNKPFGKKGKLVITKGKAKQPKTFHSANNNKDAIVAANKSNANLKVIKQHNKKSQQESESEEEIDTNEEFLSKSITENDNADVSLNKQKPKSPSDKKNKNLNKSEKRNWKDPVVQAEVNSRTLFVGNVETTIKKKHLLKFFSAYGKVQSVRLRCVTPVHPGVSKRTAVIKKLMHPKRTTLHTYITFEKREDALEALKVNGTEYKGHHLRVQICNHSEKPDPRKAIFVGNLPFDAEDDDLWVVFESYGPIKSVRIIRNTATGAGIGVGYVNFESTDSVELALQAEDIQVKNKDVRIKRYQENRKPKEAITQVRGKPDFKRSRGEGDKEVQQQEQKNKPVTLTVKKTAFQGSKSTEKKKKRKVNKGFLQKMKISQKIAPR